MKEVSMTAQVDIKFVGVFDIEKKEAMPQAQRFEAEQFEQAEQARQNINNVLGINATFESIGNDDIPF